MKQILRGSLNPASLPFLFSIHYVLLGYALHYVCIHNGHQAEREKKRMTNNIEIIWVRALDKYLANLDDHELRRIRGVTSIQGLMSDVQVLQKQYAGKASARCFDRLRPILTWLESFNKCVQTFINVSPKTFVLLWGSLSFALEVRLCVSLTR